MKTFQDKSVLKNRQKRQKILILMSLLLCILVLLIGFIANKFQFNESNTVKVNKNNNHKALVSVYNNQSKKNNGLHTLDIYLSPASYKAILQKYDELERTKALLNEVGQEVPATLSLDGNDSIPIEIRLKGDDLAGHIHPEGYKWPYRIKMVGKNRLFGMSRFSIHADNFRHGHEEMLLLNYQRKKKILAPRYMYVNVHINGIDHGVMALEEHFTKEMLESMGMRESVILAFDEDYFWRQRALNHRLRQNMFPSTKRDYGKLQFGMHNIPFKVFNERDVWKSPVLKTYYKEALGLMRAFRSGQINQADVIDNEVYGKYQAYVNLWNRQHGLLYYNIRMYYNPITRLFEPISFDNDYLEGLTYNPLAHLTSSQEFINVYKETLRSVLNDVNEGKFFEILSLWENKIYSALNDDSIGEYKRFSRKKFEERLAFLQNHNLVVFPEKTHRYRIHPVIFRNRPILIEDFILVFVVKGEDGKSYLEFQNVTGKSVTINEIFFTSNLKSDYLIKKKVDIPESKIIIPPYLTVNDHIKIPVPAFPINGKEKYHVVATYDHINYQKEFIAKRYFPLVKKAKYRPDRLQDLAKKFPFLQINYVDDEISKSGNYEEKFTLDNVKSFTIPEGKWHVKDHMLLPVNKPLFINAGAELSFEKGKRLVVRSPLIARGNKNKPVIFQVYRSSNFLFEIFNPFKYWGGIVVLKSHGDNILNNVIIKDIGPVQNDDWKLTGAVTFYESPVDIVNCTFKNNKVEDVLNIIRSSFTINDTTFKDSKSDAVDIDYGHGSFNDVEFYNTGGDAIDVSGSEIEAENVIINKTADKAISVGEKSNFSGKNIDINNANIGIVSKDSSITTIKDSKLSFILYTAFMAYIKKPEYGKSELIVNNTKTSFVNQLSGAIKPCTVLINNKIEPFKDIDLSAIYDNELQLVKPKGKFTRIKDTQQEINNIDTPKTLKKWERKKSFVLYKEGATILLDDIYHNQVYYLNLNYKNEYRVMFYNDSNLLDFVKINAKVRNDDGTFYFQGITPDQAVINGFNRIIIYPFTKYNKEETMGSFYLGSREINN